VISPSLWDEAIYVRERLIEQSEILCPSWGTSHTFSVYLLDKNAGWIQPALDFLKLIFKVYFKNKDFENS